MHRPSLAAILLLFLSACGPGVQTSSGAEYLARYRDHAAQAPAVGTAATLPQDIEAAASVEPLLRFPAKFGLARIVNGRLSAIPAAELEHWTGLAGRFAHLGEFAAISPLAAAFTAETIADPGRAETGDRARRRGRDAATDLVRRIRLGAARQHVDAVLVYEVGARTSVGNTALALADLTIIGSMILPTRNVAAAGAAEAILLDVRNGYVYGDASATADLSRLATSWGNDERRAALRERAVRDTVAALAPRVEEMLLALERAMQARGGKQPPRG